MTFPTKTLLLLIALPILILLEIQHLHIFTDSTSLPSWLPDLLHPPRPRVSIPQGAVLGSTIAQDLKTPVEAFRGIPYAKAPVGERRFRRAEAVDVPGSDGVVIDAGRMGKRCPGKQLIPLKGDIGSDEDCLTVNVFRPKGVAEGQKVPVAVYIHGGAYNRGSALMHNTASMVGWSERPFVGVSFNYRIGALGFLPSVTTAKEGLLNLGLHDQLLLLQWVQDNIASFGGDPGQVTLFGVSAGAHSIAHHIMNTDLGHSLFHRAIIESGAATSRAVHTPDAALHESQFRQFVTESHCADIPDADIFACLRNQPSSVLANASFSVFDKYNPSVRWAFQPVIDNELIKRRPIDAWRSGAWNKMPILTGFNTNEGTYYVPVNMSTSTQFTQFFHTLLPAYSDQDIQTIDSLYPDPSLDPSSPYKETRPIPVGAQYKRVEAAYGHYAYACPVRQTAHFASLDTENPVFLYRWALNKTVQGGANHADQLPYEAYDVDVRTLSEAQDEVAGTLHAYFTSFIVAGDPNAIGGYSRPVWERYAGEGRVMVFGEGNDERAGGDGVGVAAGLQGDGWGRRECGFWEGRIGFSG
ncbi:alpha/beta-hydrolase [Aspergillus steynii IBT 23096]|uniref:Carboxylic ester hydrolase n=1 Tax=Aspergillus steynii IBT 23096 TaxID=1392250 RepID=A0A2I2GFG2_9EURO|nr:alpha/beta-hydrolase [Aspergillus steynii IBT 23096]PLB51626.1 alpha/beta-hydrolase [Aspergillus steynii IBT 23096]